jgi:hypothetical protein
VGVYPYYPLLGLPMIIEGLYFELKKLNISDVGLFFFIIMFEYLLMPLSKHADDGFGAVGRSFQDAADQLRQSNHEASARWMHGHLPINYLYRHAIELYLKSMIIVAHRRLRLPSTDGAYEPIPKIKVVNNFKKIHNVHGIQALYDEMKRIFVTNRDLIAKIAKTDWTKIPEDLETSIATVESVDPGSTVFRYPTSDSPVADKQKCPLSLHRWAARSWA